MIRRLVLENWRAYERLDLSFERGATFVVAPNGVGKSSIVEGARFALFGFVPPTKEGASRITGDAPTTASVDVELPSGRFLSVTRPYPTKPRGSATPAVTVDGGAFPAEALEPLLAEEYGADPAFLARLAMLHSSTVFTEAKGLDLRDHLCHVFGVDGLVAALDQTKILAQGAKKSADSTRKVIAVSDDEVADLVAARARAEDLLATAETARASAERDLAAARADAEARSRQRAELAGRMQAISAGLADLESAEGSCPVCRRPLEAADVERARSSHEHELAALQQQLGTLESEPVPIGERDAVQRFDAAVAAAAEARAVLTELTRRREAAAAARVEIEAVTMAFERTAALEAAATALDTARRRILNESVEPLEDLLAENWRMLFADRPGVGLQGDGTVSRRIGSEELGYEHFSDGEKMVAQLILRVLVLRATTKLGFFWVDEPLEHLDPDARRALAVLLAQAPEEPSFPQVLVTTYEEPLIRRLRTAIPNTHLVYVRPSLPQPVLTSSEV